MSCYFRNMKDIFNEAGIEITPENKKTLDRAIHQIVGVEYKDCPSARKKLKNNFLSDPAQRRALVKKLQDSLK